MGCVSYIDIGYRVLSCDTDMIYWHREDDREPRALLAMGIHHLLFCAGQILHVQLQVESWNFHRGPVVCRYLHCSLRYSRITIRHQTRM